MEKIPVIYWSGTGNTKLMAEAVAEGIGTAAELKSVSDITPEQAYEVLDACYVESFWMHFNPSVLESARVEAQKIFEAQSRRGNP